MRSVYKDIFTSTCRNRYFELEAAEAIRTKLIKLPTYLSIGEEHIPAALACAKSDWLLFPQHRCHSYFLSFGGPPDLLAKELLGRKDGCNAGMGGSASVSWKDSNIFGHSGLLGDQIPIAVGAAFASQKPTLVIGGDAAMEEDYALAALGYAATWKAPILFVCEDNNLSILTKKRVRRSWEITDVAKGFGIKAIDIEDDPILIFNTVQYLLPMLPALINIRTCRHLWHAGAGTDGPPRYNRFEMFKEDCKSHGLPVESIEQEAAEFMRSIWQPLLKQ